MDDTSIFKFFHLNALSSPILIKIHFDVIMTMIPETLYCRLTKQLRGFEDCDAPKIFRNFVKGGGPVEVRDAKIGVKKTTPGHFRLSVRLNNLRIHVKRLLS